MVSSMAEIYLSVIIPGKNQAKRLSKTLDDILAYINKRNICLEVIYVDGDSTDQTPDVLTKYRGKFENFTALKDTQLGGNFRGKGAGVKLGMLTAKGKFRMFMDADSSTPFCEIDKLLPYLEEDFDIAMGSRYIPEALPASNNTLRAFGKAVREVAELLFTGKTSTNYTKVKQGWLRQFMSRGGNLAFVMLLGLAYNDTRCGFKAYSRKATEILFPLQLLPGFGFDTELLVIARKHGLRVIEVPVDWYNDKDDTTINPISDSIKSFREIFRIKWNSVTGKYKGIKKT